MEIEEIVLSNQAVYQATKPEYRIKSIKDQVDILRGFFPGLGLADEKIAERQLPEGAEAWMAIPKYWAIPFHLNTRPFVYAYHGIVNRIFSFMNRLHPALFSEMSHGPRLYYDEIKRGYFDKISKEQKGFDILVVPVNFGLCDNEYYDSYISGEKHVKTFYSSDYNVGLGVYEIAIMLLTHLTKDLGWGELLKKDLPYETGLVCEGDMYAPHYDDWNFKPYFYPNKQGEGLCLRTCGMTRYDLEMNKLFIRPFALLVK